MDTKYDLIETPIPWRDLWAEIIALGAAFIIPSIFLVIDLGAHKPDLFQRGGTVALFIVAVLGFKSLADLNSKHINNAVRARRGSKIKLISTTRTNFGWLTLIGAIWGAAISAFGDKFENALLKIFC